MARRPSRYTGGPAYSIPSVARLKALAAIPKVHHHGGSVGYSTMQFAAPREEASGKRSYKDARGRVRWGKPHVVQRFHAKRRGE
jgi:hypothetical protein